LEPQHLRFGGGTAETVLNPLVLLIVLVVGALILFWPRGRAIAPFLAGTILIPMDQVLVVAGMHFPALRVLALFGIARLVRDRVSSKGKIFSGGINKIDIAVIALTLCIAVAGVLLFQESGALIYQLGNIYTTFGIYFLLRFLIRGEDDIVVMIRALAYVAAAIALVMTIETLTGHNPYALLGGARASMYANVAARDDRFRAQGPFGHAILAGVFGAILLPLFVLLWQSGRKNRWIAALGMVSATVITLTSNSSTPVLAYAGGVVALCLWPIRNWMRLVRWGVVLSIVALHMVMKAPVWHLVSRIDISGGSSGYHRFMLIDQCIRHFGDWWLIGVKSTYDWGWDMWDTANQYVGICDTSGLLAFILFLASIVYGFKYLGKARRRAKGRKQQLFMWALGAALFANAVAFFGISYWDQTQVVWYALLAAISAATMIRAPQKTTVTVGAPGESAALSAPFSDFPDNQNDPAEVDPLRDSTPQRFSAI
jgi:hypothetical protein